jgi:Mg2+ and Co2+ transporter CorA
MDKSSEEGKWLSKFYGLSFLPPEDVENRVARQQLKVNNDYFYFHGWCKVKKVFRTGFKCSVDE